MKLRALRALKREAKSAFIFVLERGAPLHRALAGPSNPAGSGRRQRVAVVCWRKQIRRLQRTPTLPPCWTGRGAFGAQKIVPSVTGLRFLEVLRISWGLRRHRSAAPRVLLSSNQSDATVLRTAGPPLACSNPELAKAPARLRPAEALTFLTVSCAAVRFGQRGRRLQRAGNPNNDRATTATQAPVDSGIGGDTVIICSSLPRSRQVIHTVPWLEPRN